MAKSAADLITILRNMTGRIDASDPLFTDEKMLGYLTDFIQLNSPQDVRIYRNKTWYEFTFGPTNPNPYPIDLQALVLANGAIGATTLEPPCYADGFPVFWYQSPAEFYGIWPETQTYQPQRPTYVLYYNNELTFRGPPLTDYLIKIAAYQIEFALDTVASKIHQDYLYRYFVYGAGLDIFADYGEIDKYNEYFIIFKRYRALVLSTTYNQNTNQRPSPEF